MANEQTLPHGRGSVALWLEGRCLELSMTASYWPFLDLLREYFGWSPAEDEAARAGRLVAALRELVSRGDLSETRFDEIGPLLGHLFSLRFGNEWDERLKNAGPEEIKHRTFMAIRDLLLALSQRQPLILVLEDLHWADSLSLDLISLLMEAVTLAPLFLFCVYRPEREHKCWHLGTIAARKCAERYTEISLRELTAGQSRRLIESLLSIDNLPPSVKEAILQKSGGNPFFVEEVVRSLIASGMVYQEGDVWKAREGIESVTVPESIQSVILSRVDRLEQNLKRVLQSAAVIGRLFRRRLLEHTAREATALERDLWELEEQALIYQERAVPEEEYSFKHVLTQETIYQNILRPRRAAFHQQVGEAIEALYQDGLEGHYEQLAYHYERSAIDEKAVEYLLKAGEKAQRAYLNEEAIGYFERALKRLDRSSLTRMHEDWRLVALRGLGQTFHEIGREADAEECFREAITLGRAIGLPARDLLRLYTWLANILYWRSRFDAMIQIGEEGLQLLGEGEAETVEAALANDLAGLGYWPSGGLEKGREFFLRNVAILRQLPYSEEIMWAYNHIVAMYINHDQDVAEATIWLEALKQKAGEHHDLRGLGRAYVWTGGILARQGDLRGSLAWQQQALDHYTRMGYARNQRECLMGIIGNLLAQGELRKAEEALDRAFELSEQVGLLKGDVAYFPLQRGIFALCRGSWQQDLDLFEEAARLEQEVGLAGGRPLLCLGRALLAQGEHRKARQHFAAALTSGRAGADQLAALVAGVEEAERDPAAFAAFCAHVREEHPALNASPLVQWFLEAAEPNQDFQACRSGLPTSNNEVQSPADAHPNGCWIWYDPLGDCTYALEHGLAVNAANGRDLRQMNRSAPRLTQPVDGDFAVQTVWLPASEEKPAMGGLLLWKDRENYLRLDRGTRGKHEIAFQGCLENKDVIIGRGRLPSERIFLRLERRDGRVRALCSENGEEWFTAGQVEFPVEDPVEVGLHAIGMIDRTLYPGAFPDGTAIRFESFDLWPNK